MLRLRTGLPGHKTSVSCDEQNTGAWDSLGVMTPSVIKNGSTYEMWYSGVDVSACLLTGLTGATSISDIETALTQSGVDVGIGYATSPNGETWTKAATPVLEKGSSTDWDSWCFRAVRGHE